MNSPISPATHEQSKRYSTRDVLRLRAFIRRLVECCSEHKPIYHIEAYKRHAVINADKLVKLAKRPYIKDHAVPADLLFWLVRSSAHFNLRCPVTLPHICKLTVNGKECFFVTTKEEWAEHRAAQKGAAKIWYTDHAKINYLERVLGIDVNALMVDAPTSVLGCAESRRLSDGRNVVEHGDHQYITANGVCVSVLDRGMQVE